MKPAYRADIDALRGLAIAAVVLYHFKFEFMRGGFAGVDLFFVISGYLITGASLGRLESLRDAGEFFKRRVARLVPMVTFTILATVAAAWFTFAPSEASMVFWGARSVALFYSNVFLWSKFGYFQTNSELNPFLHTWSLGVEEQFYLVMPFLLLAARRRAILALAVVSLVSFSLMAFVAKPAGAFYLMPCRMWEMGVGALLVYAKPPSRPAIGAWCSVAGLSIFGLALVFMQPTFDQLPSYRLLPAVAAALVIWGGSVKNGVGRVLDWKPLTAIGARSYSIYLLHLPLWIFIAAPSERPIGFFLKLALIAVTLIASFVAFRFIEQPAQRRMRSWSGARVVGATVVMISLSVGIPWALAEKSAAIVNADTKLNGRSLARSECALSIFQEPSQYSIEKCVPTGAREKWLVIGDSFAAHYVEGLRQVLANESIQVVEAANAGCPPFRVLAGQEVCEKFSRRVFDEIIPRAKATVVIVGARWSRDLDRLGTVDFRETLSGMIRELKSSGARVVLIDEGPEFYGSVPHVFGRRGSSLPPTGDRKLPARSSAKINAILRDITTAEKIERFDWAEHFCEEELCLAARDGRPLFIDHGHLNERGSAISAEALVRVIRRSSP